MKIAVIGAGINGLMVARKLHKENHEVAVYEKDKVMCGTSSKSTKLIHGGLRYFESFQFSQVRESLIEREFWLNYCPDLVKPIEFLIPIYRKSYRKRWKYKIGLSLYELLAGKSNIKNTQSLTKEEILKLEPGLVNKNLMGGFSFFDAQMNDYKLGLFVAEEIKSNGVQIYENKPVIKMNIEGEVFFQDGLPEKYDLVINVSGPSAEMLLIDSNISSNLSIDLIRGSHITFDDDITSSLLLESPYDKRLFFVISYDKKTLVGTTEVRQQIHDPIEASQEELEYLVNSYNRFYKRKKSLDDIKSSFSGVRPLIRSQKNINRISREYAFEKNGKLITVFGGKWTSSRKLAERLVRVI